MAYGRKRWRRRGAPYVRGRRFKRRYGKRRYYGRRRGHRATGVRRARKMALGMKKVYQLGEDGVAIDWLGRDAATPSWASIAQVNNPGDTTSGEQRDTGFGTLYFSGCKLRYVLQVPNVNFTGVGISSADPFTVNSPVFFVRVLLILDRQLRLPGVGPPTLDEFLDVAGDEYDPMMAMALYNEQLILKRGKIIFDRLHRLTRNTWAQSTAGNAGGTAFNTTGNQVLFRKVWIRLPRRRLRATNAGSENEGKGAVYMYVISSADPAYTTAQKPTFTYTVRSYFRDGTGLP